MTAFEEGDNAHVIKMGVQDEELLDPVLIHAKFLELPKNVRNDIAHASADNHGAIVSFEKIDPGFLSTQTPNSLTYVPWFSNSHFILSSLFMFFTLLEEGVDEKEEGENSACPGEDISVKGIKGFSI
jgi:hypothetical protein